MNVAPHLEQVGMSPEGARALASFCRGHRRWKVEEHRARHLRAAKRAADQRKLDLEEISAALAH